MSLGQGEGWFVTAPGNLGLSPVLWAEVWWDAEDRAEPSSGAGVSKTRRASPGWAGRRDGGPSAGSCAFRWCPSFARCFGADGLPCFPSTGTHPSQSYAMGISTPGTWVELELRYMQVYQGHSE